MKKGSFIEHSFTKLPNDDHAVVLSPTLYNILHADGNRVEHQEAESNGQTYAHQNVHAVDETGGEVLINWDAAIGGRAIAWLERRTQTHTSSKDTGLHQEMGRGGGISKSGERKQEVRRERGRGRQH